MSLKNGISLAALAIALYFFAQRIALGIAWEDSYHHWLLSAHGWVTGDYQDPLAGHTAWLPVVHWIYGLVLGISGIYNLQVLAWLAAGVTVLSAGLIYRRRGLGLALLFLFNPVTLLVGSLPTTEPWSLLFLLAGWSALPGAWGVIPLLLAIFSDRGVWPLVLGYGLLRPKEPTLWLALLAIGGSISLDRVLGSLAPTAAWAGVDQPNLAQLFYYSAPLLLIPLLVAGWSLLPPKVDEKRTDAIFLYLGLSYLGMIGLLVATGQLTGSPRYYLPVIALLALGSRPLPRWGIGGLVVLMLPLNFYYFQLWPQWVVLNQPSVLAGVWLRGKAGTLYTDSPVIAYTSHWSLDRIKGSSAALAPNSATGYVALAGDARYTTLFPALGQTQNWPLVANWSQDWTVGYGAKPVRVYRLWGKVDGPDRAVSPPNGPAPAKSIAPSPK